MSRKKKDFELPAELSDVEFEKMIDAIHKYEVKFPDEAKINQTVQIAMLHLQTEKSKMTILRDLLCLARLEITFFNRSYWFFSLLIYIVGGIFIGFGINPYVVMLGIAPMPFILGLIEVFRNRENGMLELEASCKFNAASVILAKLIVTAIYNVVLNFVASIIFNMLNQSVTISLLTMYWLTAFTVVCGIALVIMTQIRSSNAVFYIMTLWAVIGVGSISIPALYEFILHISPLLCIVMITVGITFSIYQVHQLYNQTKKCFEREDSFEINFE